MGVMDRFLNAMQLNDDNTYDGDEEGYYDEGVVEEIPAKQDEKLLPANHNDTLIFSQNNRKIIRRRIIKEQKPRVCRDFRISLIIKHLS